MKHWITFYRPATGLIVSSSTVTVGDEDRRCGTDDVWWIDGLWNGGEYRVDPETLEPVALHEFAPVIEPNRVSNLPEGTTAIYRNHCDVIDDGELELDSGGMEIDVRVILTKDLYRPAFVTVRCGTEP